MEYARNALCAWGSIPDKNEDMSFVNFGELSDDFPELVNSKAKAGITDTYRLLLNL